MTEPAGVFPFEYRDGQGEWKITWHECHVHPWEGRVPSVRALAFDVAGDLAIVRPAHDGFHLPGGGVERSESVEVALRREMGEELDAQVVWFESIGYQRAFLNGRDASGQQFFAVGLDLVQPFAARFEIVECRYVRPAELLASVVSCVAEDPKMPRVLELAVGAWSRRAVGGV